MMRGGSCRRSGDVVSVGWLRCKREKEKRNCFGVGGGEYGRLVRNVWDSMEEGKGKGVREGAKMSLRGKLIVGAVGEVKEGLWRAH